MSKKLLPTAGKADSMVVCRGIMSACSFGDIIINIIVNGNKLCKKGVPVSPSGAPTENPKIDKLDLFESIGNLVTMILDFGASYISGYYIYSPMEPDDENSEYAKKLASVNTACSIYTKCWLIKSALNAFQSIVALVLVIKKKEEVDYYNIPKNTINIIISGFSAITEATAIYFASEVKIDQKSYIDEDIDKTIFVCDTVGYLTDDIRAILDSIFDLGLKKVLKNQAAFAYLAIRELLAAIYGSSMACSANLLNTNR